MTESGRFRTHKQYVGSPVTHGQFIELRVQECLYTSYLAQSLQTSFPSQIASHASSREPHCVPHIKILSLRSRKRLFQLLRLPWLWNLQGLDASTVFLCTTSSLPDDISGCGARCTLNDTLQTLSISARSWRTVWCPVLRVQATRISSEAQKSGVS